MSIIKAGIITGGILSLLLAVLHSLFFKAFAWEEELKNISMLNRRILYTIHVFLALLFLPFAFISFVYVEALSRGTGLAAGITLSYSFFWLFRLLWQIACFSPEIIPRKERLLFLHYSLIGVFFLLFLVYLAPVASTLFG